MRLRLLTSLGCLLLLAGRKAGAQLAPADDFFHGGAQLYISNSIPQAKEVVEQGLKLYPDDNKLKQLEALLNQKQQEQQQQQNQQNQQQQNQQNKSDDQKKQDQQKSQDQSKPDQQKPDQQKQDDQKKDQSDQKKDDQQNKPDQQKPQPAQDKDKDKDKDAAAKDKPEEGQPVKPGEMTPEEAKHLLDAQKDGEQLLQLKPPEKPHDPSRPVKDW